MEKPGSPASRIRLRRADLPPSAGLTIAHDMSPFGDMLTAREDPVWRALADPTRRRVLDLCADRPRTSGEVCAAFPSLARTSVLKHLGILVEARLVSVEREGRRRHNATVPETLARVCLPWVDRHARRLARRMDRLRRWAEAGESSLASPTAPAKGASRERREVRRRAGRRRHD
jgi:DNA-binding transcriptional ArsR family regulator